MNLAKHIIHIPYLTAWRIRKLFDKKKRIDFLCGNIVDFYCFKPIYQLMSEIRLVAKNKTVQRELKDLGIRSVLYPTFPDVIVMTRHLAWKYPDPKIKKIGLRHGAYHFKDFVAAHRYNAFDKFLVTSKKEVELAAVKNIVNAIVIGFPKIDPMFNGEISEAELKNLRAKLNLDPQKATIIFTTTWDKTNYSAITKWIHRLPEISKDYNVLVTVHHWTTDSKKQILENTDGIYFVKEKDILPFLLIADILVGDISSIIAEFNSLDKSIITFKVPLFQRFTSEIKMILEKLQNLKLEPIIVCHDDRDTTDAQRMFPNHLLFFSNFVNDCVPLFAGAHRL
ncbi:MAG: CDP-glycerol glycerophosphotransferase family protein [Candidatus Cloacimonetes bacterium]|nr:CDP-glycerol glycerophosphotransferase family protein [Candidatus Cloacimonadota bacterium]